MRKNRILTAAITTALSLSSWTAYGAITTCGTTDTSNDYQFENVASAGTGGGACRGNKAIQAVGESGLIGGNGAPNAGFDFTGGQSVISIPYTDGVPFATELFGGKGTGLTLPSVPSTGTGGSTPGTSYMAVVYTIDGPITQNFNMIFTLDSGATFAEAPLLGIKDTKSGTSATVTIPPTTVGVTAGTSTSMGLSASALTTNDLFRFSDHPTPYLVSGASGTTYTFYQLGTASRGVSTTTVTTSSKVYKSAQPTYASIVSTAGVTTVSTANATTAATTLSVNNTAAFTPGWSYICNATTSTEQSIFNVVSTPGATAAGVITVKTISSGLSPFNLTNTTGGLLSTDCSTSGMSIYRIHVPGDTVISLGNYAIGSKPLTSGQAVQFDVITSSPGPFNNTTQYKTASALTASNTVTLTGALSTILLGGEHLYDPNIPLGDGWIAANSTATGTLPLTPVSGGANSTSATFTLNAGTTTPNLNLNTNDQVMLLYKLSNAGALAAQGKSINMNVDLTTGGSLLNVIVNTHRAVTVANSVKALNVSLASLDPLTTADDVKIDLNSGQTQFSGDASGYNKNYVENTIAQYGVLTVNTTTSGSKIAVMEDGVSPFKFSTTAPIVYADNSKLRVTGGQFHASLKSPGQLSLVTNVGTIIANSNFVSQDQNGDWNALWNLNTAEMQTIAASSPAYLRIQADGVTQINTVENPPHGQFTIGFNNPVYSSVTTENDLYRILRGGVVCTVYQIPPAAKGQVGQDIMSIRITNNSATAGKIRGTLYDMDGSQLGSTIDLRATELAPNETMRIDSDALGTLFGVTWKDRAVLKVQSSLPKMEVMALIRQRNIPFAPLSNLSAGAKGTSCETN